MKKLQQQLELLRNVPGLYEFASANCFLAGGAVRDNIRNLPPKDYDMFFRTAAAKDEFIQKFGSQFVETGYGNYNWEKFQFITLVTGSPKEVTDTFDYSVNQVWFEFGGNRAHGEISSNMFLHFNTKSRTPLSAIMRLPRLLEKGFKIEAKELLFAYTFVSLSVNMANAEAVNSQQMAVSNNGGPISGVESVTARAVKAVLENSPLFGELK